MRGGKKEEQNKDEKKPNTGTNIVRRTKDFYGW